MDYYDKLKDPRWQKRRLEVLQYADFRCQLCGDSKNTLHVHHSYYDKCREPWEYPDGALISLCKKCHNLWHAVSEGIGKETRQWDYKDARDELYAAMAEEYQLLRSIIGTVEGQQLQDLSAQVNEAKSLLRLPCTDMNSIDAWQAIFTIQWCNSQIQSFWSQFHSLKTV